MEFGKTYLIKFLFGILVLSGGSSCERSEGASPIQHNSPEVIHTDTVKPSPPQEVGELPLFVTYHIDSLENIAQIDSFKTRFSELQQEFILGINRKDAYRLRAGDKLVIPDTLTINFLDYSPFPQNFEMLDSIPKVVLISRRIQGFALYENGKLLKWGPVSSGKRSTPTPAGLFYGNYKARSKISTVDQSWIMPYYFNFMNFEGVGVHQYSMPGFPASHACVRLRKDDAITIYNWANQWKLDGKRQVVRKNGTPFMVFGDYDFDRSVPWLELAEDPNSNYLNAEEMKTLRRYVTEYRRDKRNFDLPELPSEELSAPPRSGLETIQ
ncbi:L,D-transpeptidase [Salinimicrobium sediminilitoris]|uniref:L,D-transpeptidase n=1 Tax=Salinimicrobium sediminilitoris TaxID=2876715 RepID=UPI001E310E8B|nr:L,D-transpeptidase [Salinimicrobium sediminilitoris]MCC8359096.1 L,D-transpeptidase family protein [Salinimicrobium sediminilitoris]